MRWRSFWKQQQQQRRPTNRWLCGLSQRRRVQQGLKEYSWVRYWPNGSYYFKGIKSVEDCVWYPKPPVGSTLIIKHEGAWEKDDKPGNQDLYYYSPKFASWWTGWLVATLRTECMVGSIPPPASVLSVYSQQALCQTCQAVFKALMPYTSILMVLGSVVASKKVSKEQVIV